MEPALGKGGGLAGSPPVCRGRRVPDGGLRQQASFDGLRWALRSFNRSESSFIKLSRQVKTGVMGIEVRVRLLSSPSSETMYPERGWQPCVNAISPVSPNAITRTSDITGGPKWAARSILTDSFAVKARFATRASDVFRQEIAGGVIFARSFRDLPVGNETWCEPAIPRRRHH